MNSRAEELFRLAQRDHQAGHLAEAETAYRQALAADPDHAGALHGLGTLALQADDANLAERLIARAIALRGEWALGCYHLGAALQSLEQFDSAIVAFRKATVLDPTLFDAQSNLAVCLQLTGQRDKAITAYRNALAIRQDDPYTLNNFAVALRAARQTDEGISVLRRAIAIEPNFPEAFLQLGMSLRDLDRLEEAASAFSSVAQIKPESHSAWTNLASVRHDLGQIREAIDAQRRAVAIRPADADSNFGLANLLLLNGDLGEGFRLLEWRWKRKTLPWPRRRFTKPMWDGSNLAGQTIYLHAEQSIADAICYSRYIPLVATRGGRVICECQPAIRRVLEKNFAIEQWLSPGEPLPAFDVYCPLMSLPRVLGFPSTNETFLNAWKDEAVRDGVMKVGLIWAGSPSELEDRKRSMTLSDFEPLRGLPGVRFCSLQKSGVSGLWPELIDFAPKLGDFADTAAMISQVDLVISVDTAVAHLAAAMGKPTWLLLPFVPSWRWGMTGEQTALYPTMRLFRQTSRGNWTEVIRGVVAELRRIE